MSRRPEYLRDGFSPAGPGRCRCPHCRESVTTNALGRASHLRVCKGLEQQKQQALLRRMVADGIFDQPKKRGGNV